MNVQVTQEDAITLPESLCDAYNIKTGNVLSITDWGEGKFLLSYIPSFINELLDSLCNSLETEGETIESMLDRRKLNGRTFNRFSGKGQY